MLEFLIDNGEQVFRHVQSVWILILAACFYILIADAELIKNMNIKYSYEIWRRLFSDWAPAAIVMQNANILWSLPSKDMGGLTARRIEMQNYFVVGLYAKNKWWSDCPKKIVPRCEPCTSKKILYTYKLVMRAIASLWFPEMWTMTRREAEGHRSRRGKP